MECPIRSAVLLSNHRNTNAYGVEPIIKGPCRRLVRQYERLRLTLNRIFIRIRARRRSRRRRVPKNTTERMKRFILILFLLLAAREIRAFGLAGHAAIACIAEHHLTPRARANIMRYTDHRSIVYYASWMDEWRRSKGYEFTTHWHAGTVDAEFRSTPAVREASGAKGDWRRGRRTNRLQLLSE